MNGKFSQFLSLSRGYHQHGQYRPPQQPNRYSFHSWRFLLDKLKQEFASSERRLEYFQRLQNGLKMMASFLGRECSPIVAQRAFRGYRMILLHSKLWSYNSSNPVSKRALLSFVMLSLCQAKNSLKQTIADAELTTHKTDLDYIRELTAATVVCSRCKDRLAIDKKINGVKYCHCPDAPQSVFSRRIEGHSWLPFAETADLLIWRKPHPDYPGLYVYKVYGYYNDISAQDFLDAQLDMDYRKEWDDTALQLKVVEKDPKSNSEVIYWEMKWPRMFVNRDYLFVRRHKVYRDRNDMVIMSKAVTHPEVPERAGVHRVTEYWSVMHVRAAKGLSQPGVEFGLTYFDNPGLSLPQWLTTWAAITGIPDFLNKQRSAARVRRLFGKPPAKVSAPVSKSNFSDRKYKPASPPPSESSSSSDPPPSASSTAPQEESGKLAMANKESANATDLATSISNNSSTSDSPSSNIITSTDNSSISSDNSDNSTSNSTNPSSTASASQQQEGKKELLSQFFKEQILEVQS